MSICVNAIVCSVYVSLKEMMNCAATFFLFHLVSGIPDQSMQYNEMYLPTDPAKSKYKLSSGGS